MLKDSASQKSTVSEGTTAPEGETNWAIEVVSLLLGMSDLKRILEG